MESAPRYRDVSSDQQHEYRGVVIYQRTASKRKPFFCDVIVAGRKVSAQGDTLGEMRAFIDVVLEPS